jgi:NAD-dependent dihydropyrimidine dehydrogenase PreA subunit/flavodoxin
MAKIIVHYFTGTGNTAFAVKIISQQLIAAGHEVTLRQVKKDVLPPDEVFDFHIVAFPVLSWAAPVIMKRYIRKIGRGNGTPMAILAINGSIFYKGKILKGYTGQALEQMEYILRQKKYNILLTADASFPDNWTQATNPPGKEDSEFIFSQGETEVRRFTEKFLAREKELYRCGWFNRSWSWLVAGLFGRIGRRLMGKFYIADERCTGCAICARACPVLTIHMDREKPWWGTRCEDCNRCINICPEQAVQVSVPLFILHTVINTGLTIWAIRAIVVHLPGWIPAGYLMLIPMEILLIIAAIWLCLWVNMVPVDAFFRLLMRNQHVRKFFSKSYTRKYRRYTAPGYNPFK